MAVSPITLDEAVRTENLGEIDARLKDGKTISRSTLLAALRKPLAILNALLNRPEEALKRLVASGAKLPVPYVESQDALDEHGADYSAKMLLLLHARILTWTQFETPFNIFTGAFVATGAPVEHIVKLKDYCDPCDSFLLMYCCGIKGEIGRVHLAAAKLLAEEAEDTLAMTMESMHGYTAIGNAVQFGCPEFIEILASSGGVLPLGIDDPPHLANYEVPYEVTHYWLLTEDAIWGLQSGLFSGGLIKGMEAVLKAQLIHALEDLTSYPSVTHCFRRYDVHVRSKSPTNPPARSSSPVQHEEEVGQEGRGEQESEVQKDAGDKVEEDEESSEDDSNDSDDDSNEEDELDFAFENSDETRSEIDNAAENPEEEFTAQLSLVAVLAAAARGADTWKWKCRRHAIMAWHGNWEG